MPLGVKSFLQMMGPKAEQERGEKSWEAVVVVVVVPTPFLTFCAPARELGFAWLCHWVSLSARIEAQGGDGSCPGGSSKEQGSCNELVVWRPDCTSARELMLNDLFQLCSVIHVSSLKSGLVGSIDTWK